MRLHARGQVLRKIRPLILRNPARGANVVNKITVTSSQLEDATLRRYLRLKVVRHKGAPQNFSSWVVGETRLEIAVAQGLPQKSFAAALPPDVLRGSASPVCFAGNWGYAPGFRLAGIRGAEGRTRGIAPLILSSTDGEAQPRRTSGGKAAWDYV